jgi:hypothetical protein
MREAVPRPGAADVSTASIDVSLTEDREIAPDPGNSASNPSLVTKKGKPSQFEVGGCTSVSDLADGEPILGSVLAGACRTREK